jgi:hypothetical protein
MSDHFQTLEMFRTVSISKLNRSMKSSNTVANLLKSYPRLRTRSHFPHLSQSTRWASNNALLQEEEEHSQLKFTEASLSQTTHILQQESESDLFLEPEDEEYLRVVLPQREPSPIVIPWPTLLTPAQPAQPVSGAQRGEKVSYLPSTATTSLSALKASSLTTSGKFVIKHPCDVLHESVRTKNWVDADKLLFDLEALHITIRPDPIYLSGATRLLEEITTYRKSKTMDPKMMDQMENSKTLAIQYLKHHPGGEKFRTKLPKDLIKEFQPLITALYVNNHISDAGFMERLFHLFIQKKIFECLVKGGVFSWCIRNQDAQKGWVMMNDLIEMMVAQETSLPSSTITPSPSSSSSGSRKNSLREIRDSAFRLRNLHLRTLITRTLHLTKPTSTLITDLTPKEEPLKRLEFVKEVYLAGLKRGVPWEKSTKLGMREVLTLMKELEGNDGPSSISKGGLNEVEVLRNALARKPVEEEVTGRQILQTAHRGATQRIKEITQAILKLERSGRGNLLRRLAGRFIELVPVSPKEWASLSRKKIFPWKTNTTTRAVWVLARMAGLEEEGRTGEALGLFQREYYCPATMTLQGFSLRSPVRAPVELGEDSTTGGFSAGQKKMAPNKQAITQYYKMALVNLAEPTSDVQIALWNQYLGNSNDSEMVLVDEAGNIPFTLALLRTAGPIVTQNRLMEMKASGWKVGVQSWTAVATEFAKKGYTRRAFRILQDHRSRAKDELVDELVDEQREFNTLKATRTRRLKVAAENKRMFLSVAAMYFRTGRSNRAKEVLSMMNGGTSGRAIRYRRAWTFRRDRRKLKEQATEGQEA